jgi:hypothetical protein
VSVCQQDVLNAKVVPIDGREQLANFVAGIDDDRLAGVLTADDKTVFEKGRRGANFENHSD